MNAFRFAVLFGLVAVAASVTIKGCGAAEGNKLSLEWDKCTKAEDSYVEITLVSGTLSGNNATAEYNVYDQGNTTCSIPSDTFTLNCSCHAGVNLRLDCESAAGVIPSLLLIVVAVMAHLF